MAPKECDQGHPQVNTHYSAFPGCTACLTARRQGLPPIQASCNDWLALHPAEPLQPMRAGRAGIAIRCPAQSGAIAGDGLRDQAAAVWDCEDAGLAATSIRAVKIGRAS